MPKMLDWPTSTLQHNPDDQEAKQKKAEAYTTHVGEEGERGAI